MIGQTLSHFKITAKLGAGGMGEVYLAEDTELDRQVALKILPQDMAADPERLERFRREAKAVAALNHPNIVTIHGIEEADGRRFLIMELVEGESLDRLLPAEGLPLAKVFDIAIPMADALAAAHEKGIVHRDLKPANVMVMPDGRVKVLDFGLAKLALAAPAATQEAATEAATLTGEGKVMGTAPYMSPEQIQGKPVDHRSDVFALGIVLYEMASGRRPFRGDSGIELASSILKDTPSSVTDLRGELPRHLGRIIAHCLEKDPERRYQSAKDVRNELEGLREELKSGPVTTASDSMSAVPAPAPDSATMPASTISPVPVAGTRRIGLWMGVAAAVVLIAAIAWWLGRGGAAPTSSPTAAAAPQQTTSPSPEPAAGPSVAVLPFADRSPDQDQEYFTDGLTEELINALAKLPELRVAGRTSSFQFKEQSEDLRVIGEKLNVSTILEGSVRKAGDQVRISAQLVNAADGFQLWSETYDRTLEDIFAVQDEIAHAVASALELQLLGDAVATTQAGNAEAYNLLLQARFLLRRGSQEDRQKAQALLQEAIEMDPLSASNWAELGLAHARMAFAAATRDESQEALRRARQAQERALEIDPDLAIAHSRLAWLLRQDLDFAGADAANQKALQLAPNNTVVLGNAASNSAARGRINEAIALDRKVLEIDPLDLTIYFNLGYHEYVAGNLDEAETLYDKLLQLSPDYYYAHGALGYVYLAQGRLGRALGSFEREADPGSRLLGLAAVNHALGDTSASDDALAELTGLYGTESPYLIAQAKAFRGEIDEAFAWLGQAFDMKDPALVGILNSPLLRSLHNDPRWAELLQSLGLGG